MSRHNRARAPLPLEGSTDVGYVPATEVAPRKDAKGQQIVDDAIHLVHNATTAAADSPDCYSDRRVPRWFTQPAHQ